MTSCFMKNSPNSQPGLDKFEYIRYIYYVHILQQSSQKGGHNHELDRFILILVFCVCLTVLGFEPNMAGTGIATTDSSTWRTDFSYACQVNCDVTP